MLSPIRKLHVAIPIHWDHHRGGWRRTVELIDAELGTPHGIRFVSAVEDELFLRGPILEPWVGFVHQVPRQMSHFPDIDRLTAMPAWRWSMKRCLGLWVLTDYQRDALRDRGVDVPIAVVRYPIEQPVLPFSLRAFEAARPRRVLFVGEFLRDYQAFYDLDAPGYEKIMLASDEFDPAGLGLVENDSVTVVPRCLAEDYDRLLAGSIVFLRLFDAVANTTVVECLARATPIVVNRIGAVTEYLGEDYPLYYDDLREASAHLAEPARIRAAHVHLRDAPMRNEITEACFLERIQNTAVYRALPTPELSKPTTFRTRDVTIVVCVCRRLDDLRPQLERFAAQEHDGWFEVILWNNNHAAIDAVERTAADFFEDLDLKVVHSSENYFCGIRLAVPALMRSELLLVCDDDVVPEPGYVTGFMAKYEEYGPTAAICARGHEFLPHKVDVDRPDRVWEDGEHLRFFDEHAEDRRVHFMHADNCLLPRDVLRDAARIPMPRTEYVLVDDYWLSFVLDHHLRVPIWKCRLGDLFSFSEAADDPERAMFHDPRVRDERVNFYVQHMNEGWPFAAPGQTGLDERRLRW